MYGPISMTEPGKKYRWGEFQRGDEPKRHRIHNVLYSHTIITQIMAKNAMITHDDEK